jgi:hypothetical protein
MCVRAILSHGLLFSPGAGIGLTPCMSILTALTKSSTTSLSLALPDFATDIVGEKTLPLKFFTSIGWSATMRLNPSNGSFMLLLVSHLDSSLPFLVMTLSQNSNTLY